MATSEILAFASTDTGTNLLTQAEYVADAQRTTGNQPGIARSKLVNKAMRQSSLISAGVAKFIADYQGNNVTDSLTPQQVADYLLAAVRFQIPAGVITMWSGAIASIPTGWFLCNGLNGTPDLRDKFVVGSGSSYSVGASGGSKDSVVVAHSHTASSTLSINSSLGGQSTIIQRPSSGGYLEGFNPPDAPGADNYDPASAQHSHTGSVSTTVQSSGVSGTDANLPPYYALAYIMKG